MSLIRKAFRRLHYPVDLIALCVRGYLAYALSQCNLEEMMADDPAVYYRGPFHTAPLDHPPVSVSPDNPRRTAKLLSLQPVEEIWGVGNRIAKKLHVMGITTALQLSLTNPTFIRKNFNVVLERTVVNAKITDRFSPFSLPALPVGH